MTAKPILYSYFRSSCSWRVRIALAFKGIDYETKAINLLKDGGENYTDNYAHVNPMQQVPAFQVKGHTIIQSSSILEYLEETIPDRPLLPKDAVQRATVRAICECIGSGIQPLQNNSVLAKLDQSVKDEWAQFWIIKGLKAVETILQTTAGKFSFGDTVTMADCYLVPQIFNAVRYKVDLTPYPVINRTVEALQEVEAFQVSHPCKQPDCPEELR